jgi:Integrase core domain
MVRPITEYVKSCPECQKNKGPTISPAGLMQITTTPDAPFDHWAIDVMGPFTEKERPTVGRYKLIIVMVDLFSRWVVARPVRNQLATTISKFLKKDIFTKYGLPQSILSDRGRNFISGEVETLLERSGVVHFTTASYHQQANAKTERVNKMIGEALRCLIDGKGHEWPTYLDAVVHALNTSFCTPIHMSPYMAVFGKEARTKVDNLLGWSPSHVVDSIHGGEEEVHYQFLLRCFARCKMELQKWDNKVRYDKRRRHVIYNKGDLVLKRKEGADPTHGKKLAPRYSGPYVVKRRTAALDYEIMLVSDDNGRPDVVHVSKLKTWTPKSRGPKLPKQVKLTGEVPPKEGPSEEGVVAVPVDIETGEGSTITTSESSTSDQEDPTYKAGTESEEADEEEGERPRKKARSSSPSPPGPCGEPLGS